MKSSDDIKQYFQKSTLSTNPEKHEEIFEKIICAQGRLGKTEPVSYRPNIGRIIMKNPIVKLAIAAVIIIACTTGYFMWTGTGSGIALADVLNRIEQVSVYMYQMSMSMSGQMVGDELVDQEMDVTVCVSQDNRMKMVTEMSIPGGGGSMLQEMYMLPKEKTMIVIMPGQKTYMQMDLDDKLVEQTKQQNNDPRAMIAQILECKYESLGRSIIDGIEVEGFRTTDPNYLAGMMGQVDVRIWVDVESQLPVRSEIDIQMGEIQVRAIEYNFQWDVTVDAADFEPVIPEDYTTLTDKPVKVPAFDEKTAIRGLQLFAEITGRYPEELNLVGLLTQIRKIQETETPTPFMKRLKEESKELSQEEVKQKVMDFTMDFTLSTQGLATFYMQLVQDKSDPVYYGDVVSPEDTDQILMRWKVSENEYRVIFGDLKAETVGPDVLVELESALPQ